MYYNTNFQDFNCFGTSWTFYIELTIIIILLLKANLFVINLNLFKRKRKVTSYLILLKIFTILSQYRTYSTNAFTILRALLSALAVHY